MLQRRGQTNTCPVNNHDLLTLNHSLLMSWLTNKTSLMCKHLVTFWSQHMYMLHEIMTVGPPPRKPFVIMTISATPPSHSHTHRLWPRYEPKSPNIPKSSHHHMEDCERGWLCCMCVTSWQSVSGVTAKWLIMMIMTEVKLRIITACPSIASVAQLWVILHFLD